MATIEQMTALAAELDVRTDESAKNRPLSEVCIFKLQPEYENDHDAVTAKFEADIVTHCKPGAPNARGIRKIAWGFSSHDPGTFVWLVDWDRIQDHWEFWKTQSFPPVIEAITTLFQPGRPLVMHYEFGDQGMLDRDVSVARVALWDDGAEGKQRQRARELAGGKGKAKQVRGGYAVDVDQNTWWCSLLGYEKEEDAQEDAVYAADGAESHIFRPEYA